MLELGEKVEFIFKFLLIIILSEKLSAFIFGSFLPAINVDTVMKHKCELYYLFVVLLMNQLTAISKVQTHKLVS